MPANIELDSATLGAVLGKDTVADKQAAVKSLLGTGTLTVTVADGTGAPVATGTFAGTALQDTGDLIPSVKLSSVSGAGGTGKQLPGNIGFGHGREGWTCSVYSSIRRFLRTC